MQHREPPEAYLVPIEDGREGSRRRLTASTVIGRASDCDVVLRSTRISRRHAEVIWDGEQFLIKDLDSLNGTALAGAAINEATPITVGDVIDLADCQLRLEFAVRSETEVFVPARHVLTVDAVTREVRVHGLPIALTPKEFRLVALLHARSPAVVAYQDIANEVWPELDGAVPEDSIAQLAARLRRKLKAASAPGALIANVRGFGYRFDPAPGDPS